LECIFDLVEFEAMKTKHNSPKCPNNYLDNNTIGKWKGSALHTESTLHQIAPYIGKMKSSMAQALIHTFTRQGDTIYDPYSGSGSVALEAWAAGRNVIANDLNPYAVTLTRAKLFPYPSTEKALDDINRIAKQVKKLISEVDLRETPSWVRAFFHDETLREIIAWVHLLSTRRADFFLSCLLGILHHERPGFLSYPSSHTVPYLREKKYPLDSNPTMYQYRPVKERLEKKVIRALKRIPVMDPRLLRESHMANASEFTPNHQINAIVTSPPYMRQLNYGRDNRLRLWFLGVQDWRALDNSVSPSETSFLKHFKSCLTLWHKALVKNGLCVFVLGDIHSRSYNMPFHEAINYMACEEIGKYSVVWEYSETIPKSRRVRRNYSGSITETILVLRKE
jgi:DNA modification methylase